MEFVICRLWSGLFCPTISYNYNTESMICLSFFVGKLQIAMHIKGLKEMNDTGCIKNAVIGMLYIPSLHTHPLTLILCSCTPPPPHPFPADMQKALSPYFLFGALDKGQEKVKGLRKIFQLMRNRPFEETRVKTLLSPGWRKKEKRLKAGSNWPCFIASLGTDNMALNLSLTLSGVTYL